MWLVRHPDLSFERPMDQKELIAKIEAGEFKAQDEVCAGDGYWFSLNETEEVRKFFGEINLKAMLPDPVETTASTRPAIDIRAEMKAQKAAPAPAAPLTTGPTTQTFTPTTVAPSIQLDRPYVQPVVLETRPAPLVGAWSKVFMMVALFLGILILLWTR